VPIFLPVLSPPRLRAGRLLRSAGYRTPSALRFGNATSDRVDVGHGKQENWDTKPIWSMGLLLRVTTFTSARALIGKYTAVSSGSGWQMTLADTLGNLNFKVSQITTSLSYNSAGAILAPVGSWHFICVSYDNNGPAGGRVKFYGSASERQPLKQLTYGTITEPVGGLASDSAVGLELGNFGTAPASALQGDIALAWVAMGTFFSFDQHAQWTNSPLIPPTPCSGFWVLGDEPVRVLDLSGRGNVGTIT